MIQTTIQGVLLLTLMLGCLACDDPETAYLSRGTTEQDSAVDLGALPSDSAGLSSDDAFTPAPKVIFVDPDAENGGDGTRFSPLTSVDAAYALARVGDLVLLLPGSYAPIQGPPDGIRLQGSGADVTIVRGPLLMDGEGADIAELTIFGGEPTLDVIGRGEVGRVHLDGSSHALRVRGRLFAEDLTIRTPHPPEVVPVGFEGLQATPGGAVIIDEGGRLVWSGGGVIASEWIGLRVRGELEAEDIYITQTKGPGILNENGQTTARRLRMEQTSVAAAMLLDGSLSLIEASMLSVRKSDGIPPRDGLLAYGGEAHLEAIEMRDVDTGIRINEGATVQLRGIRIDMPSIDGVSSDGGQLIGSDLVVNTPGNSGLSAVAESDITFENLSVSMSGRIGVLVDESTFAFDGLTIDGSRGRGVTLSECEGELLNIDIADVEDVGIQITDIRGAVRVSGGRITHSRTSGIAVTGSMETVDIENLQIDDILEGSATLAEGIHLYQGTASVSGVISQNNAGAGVLVELSTLTSEGLTVRGNRGPGIVCVDCLEGTQLNGVRATENAGVGVLALQGQLSMTDFHIENTISDLSIGSGDGFVAAAGASVELSDGQSNGNQGSGYAIQGVGRAELQSVQARENGVWGLQVSCGQTELILSGDNVFEGNQAGSQNCP